MLFNTNKIPIVDWVHFTDKKQKILNIIIEMCDLSHFLKYNNQTIIVSDLRLNIIRFINQFR